MVFKLPSEISNAIMAAGITKANMSVAQILMRGFLGGCFVGLGGFLAIMVGGGMAGIRATDPGLQRLVYAAVFPTGLLLILFLGAELFTGNVMFLTPPLLERKITPLQVLRNLVLLYPANFAGCVFVAGFFGRLGETTTAEPYLSFVNDMGTRPGPCKWVCGWNTLSSTLTRFVWCFVAVVR